MRRSKYNAKPVKIDGLSFDSKKEARRYGELKLMEKAGEIRDLVFHPRYSFGVNGVHICEYEADFSYVPKERFDRICDREIVEDVKGYKTDVYKLKKKLMKAIHGIEVRET